MKQELARQKLLEEFDIWIQKEKSNGQPTERDALHFYAYIESEKGHLLNFSYRGDKWQKLKSWLYGSSRI